MAKHRLSGELAVILHADIAGSTVLVQQDEHLAHERIQDAFRRFSKAIGKYHGHVLELRGDALLARFERASDAVTATLAFQFEHLDHSAKLSDAIRPMVRVGIAIGEVIIADNTVTGAGVVLAQRVEQLARPGGLCITSAIHEALPKRMPFDLENLGDQVLKGFADEVRVYRVELSPGEPIPSIQRGSRGNSPKRNWQVATAMVIVLAIGVALFFRFQPWESGKEQVEPASAQQIPDKPSIAVLPFDNMSEDPSQDYFSDGIAEDIITDLSQLKNLAVIARNSSFTYKGTSTKVQAIGKDLGVRYLLEGSVRKTGNQIRITVQLIDAISGHHLWAERFDRELTDVFAVQDEITQRIVSELSIQLTGNEQQQLVRNETTNFEAYDLFLQGQIFGSSYTQEEMSRAAELFRQAIDLDPGFARAYGALAILLTRQVNLGYSDTPAETKQRAYELARKAVSIDPDSPQAHWALGFVYQYRGQLDEAVKTLERVVALAPSYADGYALLALIKNNMGHAEEAIQLIERGMDLNPHYSWDYLYNLGRANYKLGHYEQAAAYLEKALTRNDTAWHPRLFLIGSYMQLNRQSDAEWEVLQLGMSHPAITMSHLKQVLAISDAELEDRLSNDLRAAGIAE